MDDEGVKDESNRQQLNCEYERDTTVHRDHFHAAFAES